MHARTHTHIYAYIYLLLMHYKCIWIKVLGELIYNDMAKISKREVY